MRVVLDTNVIVSAFLWQKNLKLIYDAVRSGTVMPCITAQTYAELARTLSYPKFKPQIDRVGIGPDEILGLVSRRALVVTAGFVPDVITDDPTDNHILACALASRASFVVSGDKHLLVLGSFDGIPIVTPEEFVRKIAQ